MSVKRERKITFTNVGIIEGSRVWRNRETGVEIIKDKNFPRVGLYYVYEPTQVKIGSPRRVVSYHKTLTEARHLAGMQAMHWRTWIIANACTEACLEDSDREGAHLMAVRDVVANSGRLGEIPGPIPGGLCVRDTKGREYVTMGTGDQYVSFTSGFSWARADVADWIVVADFRPEAALAENEAR